MKKILLLIVMLVICITSAFAKRDVRLKSGDLKVLTENANVICELDLKDAAWEEDESLKKHLGDRYDGIVETIAEAWPTFFTKYSEHLKISTDAPKYKVLMKLTNFEKSIMKGKWSKPVGVEFYGEIYFIDIASGETVLTITIDGEDGEYDWDEKSRYAKTVEEICESMFELD